MGNVLKMVLTFLVGLVGAFICALIGSVLIGALMYWSNASTVCHAILSNLHIADLTYVEYVSGAFFLSFIIGGIFPKSNTNTKE